MILTCYPAFFSLGNKDYSGFPGRSLRSTRPLRLRDLAGTCVIGLVKAKNSRGRFALSSKCPGSTPRRVVVAIRQAHGLRLRRNSGAETHALLPSGSIFFPQNLFVAAATVTHIVYAVQLRNLVLEKNKICEILVRHSAWASEDAVPPAADFGFKFGFQFISP